MNHLRTCEPVEPQSHEHASTGNDRKPRAQPVHVVEEIEGVGKGHDPDDRQNRVERQ